ncbi:MAG: M48 family metallopeptidase [Sneathiella sp.]|nr:M48 family metallopeptidase [Sneathiella sp.]
MKFSAEYYDGKTSESRSVHVFLEREDALLLQEEDGTLIARWEIAGIRDEHNPPDPGELFLSLADNNPVRLKVRRESAVRELRLICPKLNKSRPKGHNYHLKVVAGIAFAIFAGWVIMFQGIPALAVVVSGMIPTDIKRSIGDTVEEQITSNRVSIGVKGRCNDSVAEAALGRLIMDLDTVYLGEGDEPSPVPEIIVLNSKMKNAFALPGGKIIVLKGLIETAEHPNALAGVIAHEYMHAADGHPMRLYVSNIGAAAVLSLMFGDVSGGTVAAAMGQTLMGSSYSRDLELDADEGAIDLMNGAGFDVRPMANLFEKIASKDEGQGLWALLNSHPAMEERVNFIRNVTPTGSGRAFSDREWLSIKHMCDTKSDA